MNPVGILPVIIAILLVLGTCSLLVKIFGAPIAQGRNLTIDGLRGYLAFFVFLHHSSVWYFYLRTGIWTIPPSNLFSHFGSSSVAFFFMITGFLFFSKLLEGRSRKIDWGRLFISRFLRLVPLYLFAMFMFFLIIAFLSIGKLNVPFLDLIKEGVRWLSFTILGSPELNGIKDTPYIIAWVTWSLPYEWLFYFSLPILALTVRAIPPTLYILLSILLILFLIPLVQPEIYHILSFVGGILASFLVRIKYLRQFAIRRISSFLTLGCVIIAITFYPTPHEIVPKVLLSLSFALIACGNSIFGILVKPVSRFLGEMTYSIYLLHGIILYITFKFVIGESISKNISSSAHWLVIFGVIPVLIFICYFTFRLIEKPAMQKTTEVTNWLHTHLKLTFKIHSANNSL